MKRLKSSSTPILTHVLAPNAINVVMVIAATESLVINVAAAAKPSVHVIPVATVNAAMESLVTHVAAMAKPSVKTNC
jgi:hypothetical protein